MDIESKIELIKQVGEEILTEEELKNLLETKSHPIAYDGFEPSGTDIHIAQGILRSININKMAKAGVKFKMLVADWHGWANNKMGGDLEKIQTVGKYMIEVWKHCGMKLENVEFIWANDFVKEPEYWKKVMQVARHSTVNRIVRTGQIMGRKEAEVQQASQILYPCMQCADIFELKADITQLGMDQRKVNVLARELGPTLGFWKPVVVSHHMLMGLGEPPKGEGVDRVIDIKMSKSKPDTAIFMNDSEETIKRKISKAYCPAKIVDENPLMEYSKYLIFENFNSLEMKRPEKFGGDLVIENYKELEKIYSEGKIHPMDLKNAVSFYINEMVKPVREKFEKDSRLKKLLETIKEFEVTR
ncbi:MAG TPA: tyrosine--tRNA ligase [Candidatus Nanoarchaeia archaeon]|nr:tyrosine--tRNA ligase [Candidatus Nanoarchaeia archaeon]